MKAPKTKKRRAFVAARVAVFLKQVGRPAQNNGSDPNDRRYSRDVERLFQHMSPLELHALMEIEDGDDDEGRTE